jgi:ATP-dependent Clp protease ATP-binding subunit ClpC
VARVQQSFHLYIRQHDNGWLTASVLTHPEYASFGPALTPLRDEIAEVVGQELATGALRTPSPTFYEELERRVLELELRAVQHDRLILVPMRFTLLVRHLKEVHEDLYEFWLPRLGARQQIFGAENIKPWAEEVARGRFHLADVDELLKYQYERGERVERLDVVWHGRGGLRRSRGRGGAARDPHSPVGLHATPLGEVGVELVEEAKQGRLPRAYDREEELRQLLGVLDSSQRRSALLVGPAGVGKTALVHELAHRVAQGQVPPRLQEAPLWHVTGGRIIAGMKYLGQWQERCLAIVEEIRNERGILYADSVLELMMAGSAQSGMNVASFLLPYVQSGELTVLAEATPDALLLAEQQGAAFAQALRRFPVPPFSPERAYQILELTAARLEKEHKVSFTAEALGRALDVLARFGDAGSLPGSGLALIEQMARLPQARQLEAAAKERGERAEIARDRLGRPLLTASDAIMAFSRASGFPTRLIDPDSPLALDAVSRFFTERVIGQPDATELLTNLITVIKSSLNDPERPLGSFLFMGPTGVGKTESALTLAEYLFGDRKRLVRFDMSEYGYPGSASRLVGGARGEGDLTRRVREQPFSVLLFDEIEKADGEVFDILLQVLGEGRLTDGTGRTARFTHAIVIMTSNLGATGPRQIGLQGAASERRVGLADHYREAARAFFRPEFINRVDFLVPFGDLGEASVRAIAGQMLEKALSREGFARRGITVTTDPAVLSLLMEHGFDPRYGARPMKRAVEQRVLVPLSRRLVLRAEQVEERFEVYVDQGRVAVVSSRGVRGAPAPPISGLALAHDNLWARYLRQIRLRLQDWEESAPLRRLRQEGQRALPARLDAAVDDARALEEAAHELAARAALEPQARALDARLRALEWDLCLEALAGDMQITLEVEVPSLLPEALRAAERLTAAWAAWAPTRGLEARFERRDARWRATFTGAGAEALLREECGVHRLRVDEETERELIVRRAGAPPQSAVVREASADPPTLWDPTTEQERPGGLDALAAHLDTFLLARMCARLSAAPGPAARTHPG